MLILLLIILMILHTDTANTSVPLYNAAVKGLMMPMVGIGTGGYGQPGNIGGEYWNPTVAEKAITAWLAAGGRRIDTSNDYGTQPGVAAAIKKSGISRSELFITSKVGPREPMGYDETLQQVDDILNELETNYIDLILIHWPGPMGGKNPDWACVQNQTTYKKCRQESWRALEEVFQSGKAKAIGVSNFEENHLQDILEMKNLIPAVNQVEFHPYFHEDNLVKFCKDRNITFNGYSNAGCPDHMSSPDNEKAWKVQVKDQPIIIEIAKKYTKTPVQVILKWSLQNGLVINPRTWDPQHMKENLDIFNFQLTDDEMTKISNVPKPISNKVTDDPKNIP